MRMDAKTEGLTYTDVPMFGAPIQDIWRFALVYNGYEACGGHEACADVSRDAAQAYRSQGYLLGLTLHELQSALFFEQRRYRHMDQMPGESIIAYINTITHAIRRHLLSASPSAASSIQSQRDVNNGETSIDKAFTFACDAHKGVHRKGTETIPYISHPVSVALILHKQNAGIPVVMAALLHDTVEDTSATLEDIEQEFGSAVRLLVEGASEPDKSLSWHERKQHTLNYLRTASYDVKMLACADKLHNAKSIISDLQHFGSKVWERFNRGRDDQIWYYSGLAESIRFGVSSHPLFDEYAEAAQELASLA